MNRFAKAAWVLTAVLALAGPALAAPPLRAGEAHLPWWLAAVLALALLVGGFCFTRGYRSFGLLAAAFLLGSAGRLTLLRDIWFPALTPTPLTPTVMAGILFLLFEAAVAVAVLWQNRAPVLAFLGRASLLIRLALVLAIAAIPSIPPTVYVAYGHMSSYGLQIVLGGMMLGLQAATLGALLLVPGPALPLLRGAAVPLAAALVSLAGSALLALFAFQQIPHVADDLCYVFQAKTFAEGHLTVPAPPEALRAGLDYYLLEIRDGRWFCTTSPGFAVLLALGEAAGFPWLVNPLLTALTVLLAHDIVRRASGNRALAALVAWLMATSPWVLASGGSLMTHSTALLMAVLGWWCLIRGGALKDGRRGHLDPVWALAGGLAMGWLFTSRQYDGLVTGAITGLALFALRPLAWRGIIGYGIGCIAAGLVYFGYNWAITGNPLLSPLDRHIVTVWTDTRNAFGFGPDIGAPFGDWKALDFRPGHSLYEGLINTASGMASLNLESLGWSTGLAFVLLLVLFAPARIHLTAGGWVQLAIFGATVTGLIFYWYAGIFYIGPRYWYVGCFAVILAAAAGITAFGKSLAPEMAGRLPTVVALLCLSALLVFAPWRGVTKYHQFRGNYAGLAGQDFGTDLIFVRSENDYQSVIAMNDPYLRPDRPIFLRDLGPEANTAAAAVYPLRATRYVLLGPAGAVTAAPGSTGNGQ